MFCHYCGKGLKDGASFCLYCGNKVVSGAPAAPPEPDHGRNRKRRKWPWLLGAVLLIAAVVGIGGCFTLWLPREAAPDSPAAETELEAYYEPVRADSVRYGGGTLYVDSHLLITASEDADYRQVEALLAELGGEIVGYISLTQDYQVNFPEGKTYDELADLIGQLSDHELVSLATLEAVQRYTADAVDYKTDPWISASYPDNTGRVWSSGCPEGANWWAEAIMMPEVWKSDDSFETVRIGLLDTYFDRENEDLTGAFAEDGIIGQDGVDVTALYRQAAAAEAQGKAADPSSGAVAHGSVDAGIIAARNNGFGICGISQNAALYGVSLYGNSEEWNTSLMAWKYGIAVLLNNQVRAISISLGADLLLFAAQQEDTGADARTSAAQEDLAGYSGSMELFFQRCLQKYDFLIVKSAGNNSGYSYVQVGVDDDHPYGYRTAESTDKQSERIQMACDAQYDFLGAVRDPDVREHIIVVGAADMNIVHPKDPGSNPYTDTVAGNTVAEMYSWQVSDFSNIGDRVDLYAPGGYLMRDGVKTTTRILSDYPDNQTDYMQGTSQAAPMVAGVAALVWGIAPDLTAADVRSVIISSADVHNTNTGFKTVNAYKAVQAAKEKTASSDGAFPEAALLLGCAYERVTDANGVESRENRNAEVTVYNADKSAVVEKLELDEAYEFFAVLDPGEYTLVVTCEGYEDREVPVSAGKNQTLYCAVELSPKASTLSRVNYYAPDGRLIYYDSYAYYDNGLLCSTTLHSVGYLSDGSSYTGDVYTALYLYDPDGNLKQTVFGSLTIRDWYDEKTGELILGYDYDDAGSSVKRSIYPAAESIEQEKFGVDPSRTEKIYGDAPVIPTDPSGGWAGAYLRDVFPGDAPTDMTTCRFIYVDSDPVPELWMDYSYGYAGGEVYTADGETTDSIYISQGVAYWIEKGNLLCATGGHMDVYYDTVYRIENGKFMAIAQGNYGSLENSQNQFDENGYVIYDYYWDDTKVTESEYEQRLTGVFDLNRAADIFQNIYTYEQGRLLLQAIAGSSAGLGGGSGASVPADAAHWNGHSYKLYELDDRTTWQDAQAYCVSLGGHLASISSGEENDFLYQLMTDQGYTSAYFGITDAETEGTWVWADGSSAGYSNWHSGEPNGENTEEDYGMFYWKYTDGTWNDGDFKGLAGRAFLCEWDGS